MMDFNPDTLRNQTRLALPAENAYLFRLGVALYGFASITSFMTEIACVLDPSISRTKLQDKKAGEILGKFRDAIEVAGNYRPDLVEPSRKTADLFFNLNLRRTDFVHAYPITSPSGKQILHRRKDSDKKYFEISEQFLDEFIKDLHKVSDGLYQIRDLSGKYTLEKP